MQSWDQLQLEYVGIHLQPFWQDARKEPGCVWCVITAGLKRHNTIHHKFFTSYGLRQKWQVRTVKRNKSELLYSAGNKDIAQVSSKLLIIVTLSPVSY